MSTAAARAGHFVQEYERVRAGLPGAAALAAERQAAIARFAELGFPQPGEEAWKYTNVTPLARKNFSLAAADEANRPLHLDEFRIGGLDSHDFVFVNGHYRPELSAPAPLPAGVEVSSIAARMAEQPDWARAGMQKHAAGGAFVALNMAFAADGACISIDDGISVDKPIQLLFIVTATAAPPAIFPRVWIRAGRGARVCVVETYRSTADAAGFTNTLTDIFAADGAAVEHLKIQDEGRKCFHVGNLFVGQGRDSSVVSHSLSFGALLSRQDIRVELDAENSAVTLNGLYVADGRQHVDHHTRVDHLRPHTRSDETYKGVLDGAARGVFNGKVVVHPHAVKTDAQQSSKCLLLSKDAEADSKPELEIYADDVKCSHGATVGQLDAAALFYLRTRGIDVDGARRLLTFAFAADVLGRIAHPVLRAAMTERLAGCLPGHLPPGAATERFA